MKFTPPYQELSVSGDRTARNSSVELFRILASFLVLVVHCNGWFVGGMPERFNFEEISSFRIGQTIIESLSVCCVNCFLIISGWYGLRLKLKTIWNINVLLICVYVPFYLIQCIYTRDFSIHGMCLRFLGVLCESYFIQCYLMLMFLSPILNAFIERYERNILRYVLCFWGIEFIVELIGNKSLGVEGGYSVIHFALVYLLARTASFYQAELLKVSRTYWLLAYFLCVLIICCLYILGIRWAWHYSNPLVILSGFCLFMPFLYRTYYNRFINWIAGSTLAVYVMHTTSPLINIVRIIDNYLLSEYSYFLYLCSITLLIVVCFFLCVFYDKLRIWIVSPLSDRIQNAIKTRFSKYSLIYG